MRRIAIILLATSVAFAIGCAMNPVTGKRELSLVSRGQEVALGKEGHGAILAEYGPYRNPRLEAYVKSIGDSLARVSHDPKMEWTFTLLDDPAVNAFALPGGFVYVTRGILAALNSEAQLAGVIGHEIGHVTARHSAQRMTQQQIAGVGLALGSVFSETFRRYGQSAEQALGLMLLKYGRDHEHQSDELGVRYSALAGWDPREMPGTYRVLRRVGEAAGQRLPGFLSTHPDPGDRETRVAALAKEVVAGRTGLAVKGREFIQRTDSLIYGRDPRNGYFEANHYFHPGLRFELELPSGWNFQDTRQALVAVEPNQKAQLVVGLERTDTDSPAEVVDKLRSSGKIAGAEGREENIHGFPAWVGRVAVPAAEQGAPPRVFALALARRAPGEMFQFIGQTATPGDENEGRMLAAVRSLRPLADSARWNPRPARVRVVKVTKAMPLSDFLAAQGPLGTTPEEIAIMNDMELGETVAAGTVVKVVTAARLR